MKADELIAELRRQFEDQASHFMASDQGQRLIGWYEQLGTRDRIALRALGGFLVALLVFAILFQPMINYGNAAQHRLTEERELLAWLKSHESAAQQMSGNGSGERDQPVASIVNSTAQKNKLSLRRYEPVDEHTVKVWLEGASFESIVKWLHALGNEQGIHALDLDVERDAQPGLVSVRLTLAG